jgi:hypothetical protein
VIQKCSEPNCRKYATIYSPAPYCDRDWARRYSTQFDEDVAKELGLLTSSVPYRRYLEWQLKNRGLTKKDGETNEENWERCKARARKSKLLGGA